MSAVASAPALAQRFAKILEGLCAAMAARMAKLPHAGLPSFSLPSSSLPPSIPPTSRHRAAFPILMLLWSRLRRTVARFTALAARVAAGNLPPPRAKTARNPGPSQTLPPSGRARLPSGLGWLIRLVPEAACYASQLQALLAEPEMEALLLAAPQAGRLLRPLCRMLAVPNPAPSPPQAQPKPALPEPRERASPVGQPGNCPIGGAPDPARCAVEVAMTVENTIFGHG